MKTLWRLLAVVSLSVVVSTETSAEETAADSSEMLKVPAAETRPTGDEASMEKDPASVPEEAPPAEVPLQEEDAVSVRRIQDAADNDTFDSSPELHSDKGTVFAEGFYIFFPETALLSLGENCKVAVQPGSYPSLVFKAQNRSRLVGHGVYNSRYRYLFFSNKEMKS